jgi:hypothetical protein
MLRASVTLILIAGALGLAVTPRGLALLGSNRAVMVGALAVLGAMQTYRLVSTWQTRRKGDRLKDIPKRPLGI